MFRERENKRERGREQGRRGEVGGGVEWKKRKEEAKNEEKD